MTDNTQTTWLKPSLFGGRFTRKQYFWRLIPVAIIASILGGILQLMLVTPPSMGALMSGRGLERYQQELMQVNLITSIPAMIFFYLPFALKRAHDIGHKGTFVITLMILGLIVSVESAFVDYQLGSILSVIMTIPALIYGCILLFKDSEKGTNEYGTSIKYPDAQ